MKLLLMHCSDEKKMKQKLNFNEIKRVKNVKYKIKKLYEERKIEEEISTIEKLEQEKKQNYRDVTKNGKNTIIYTKQTELWTNKMTR